MSEKISLETGKLLVGVTGHRDLAEPEIAKRDLDRVLDEIEARWPKAAITMLSPLAEGADRLCAEAGLRRGYELQIPLPMDEKEYCEDFSPQSRKDFERLKGRASCAFVAPAFEPLPEDPPRGFYYRQAGYCVASKADVLIALWDGKELLFKGGGGTYETVLFMREKGWGSLYHIEVQRGSE